MKAWQWLGLAAVVWAVIMVIIPKDAIETQESWFYVAKTVDGKLAYLDFHDVGQGMTVKYLLRWVPDQESADRFAERYSAQLAVDQFGGWVVSTKSEVKR